MKWKQWWRWYFSSTSFRLRLCVIFDLCYWFQWVCLNINKAFTFRFHHPNYSIIIQEPSINPTIYGMLNLNLLENYYNLFFSLFSPFLCCFGCLRVKWCKLSEWNVPEINNFEYSKIELNRFPFALIYPKNSVEYINFESETVNLFELYSSETENDDYWSRLGCWCRWPTERTARKKTKQILSVLFVITIMCVFPEPFNGSRSGTSGYVCARVW